MHSLGAVCTQAPDSDRAGHTTVIDDLMYAQADGVGLRLDVGRDSYWGTVPPGCTNLADHPIFTTAVNDLDGLGRVEAGGLTAVATGAADGASSALVNLTMVNGASGGFITADRCDALWSGPQSKSNGNHPASVAIANLSVVPLDGSGQFCVFNQQDLDLVSDVQGWFAPPAQGGQTLVPVTPERRLDTRSSTGTPPAAGSITRVDTGAPAGATAVLVNLTMTDGTGAGFITADRCSALAPGGQTKSNGNHVTGTAITNLSVVPVDADGSFCVYNMAPVDLVVDIQGSYAPNGTQHFFPTSPRRLVDTRDTR